VITDAAFVGHAEPLDYRDARGVLGPGGRADAVQAELAEAERDQRPSGITGVATAPLAVPDRESEFPGADTCQAEPGETDYRLLRGQRDGEVVLGPGLLTCPV